MEDYNRVLQIQDRLNPLSRPPRERKKRARKKIPSLIKKWQFWISMLGIYGLSLCGNALKITISDIELPPIAHKEIIQEEFVIEEALVEQEEPSIILPIVEEQIVIEEEKDIEVIKKNVNNFNLYNNLEQQQTEDTFVLNTKSRKIHYPDCRDVPKISEENYATSNENLDTLLNQGYTTCGHCFR